MQGFSQWRKRLILPTQPIQREMAPILHTFLLSALPTTGLSLVIALLVSGFYTIYTPVLSVWFIMYGVSLFALRRGHFSIVIAILSQSLIFGIFLMLVPYGMSTPTSGIMVLLSALPLLLAGLLGTRWTLWLLVLSSTLLYAILTFFPTRLGSPTNITLSIGSTIGLVLGFAIVVFLLAISLDRFSNKLRVSILNGLHREQELETIRDQQEKLIAKRTAELSQSLADVQQREQQLSHTLADLQAARETVRELSVPVLPVLPQVLAVPLIGSLDQERAETLMSNTLEALKHEHARYIIFDITGVPVVDTHVARVLMHTADAIKLMGAQVLLAGVQPDVAQTMVSLGLDLSAFVTQPDLRTAIAFLQQAKPGAKRSLSSSL